MTLLEMQRLTGISESELFGYYSDGLIGKKSGGAACFSAQDASDVGLIRTLKGFGMTSDEVQRYFGLLHEQKNRQAADLLRALRRRMLKDIRDWQTSLDTLDCIIRMTEHDI